MKDPSLCAGSRDDFDSVPGFARGLEVLVASMRRSEEPAGGGLEKRWFHVPVLVRQEV